jgi:hypothetical protein
MAQLVGSQNILYCQIKVFENIKKNFSDYSSKGQEGKDSLLSKNGHVEPGM